LKKPKFVKTDTYTYARSKVLEAIQGLWTNFDKEQPQPKISTEREVNYWLGYFHDMCMLEKEPEMYVAPLVPGAIDTSMPLGRCCHKATRNQGPQDAYAYWTDCPEHGGRPWGSLD
jgi:hypothetical protein